MMRVLFQILRRRCTADLPWPRCHARKLDIDTLLARNQSDESPQDDDGGIGSHRVYFPIPGFRGILQPGRFFVSLRLGDQITDLVISQAEDELILRLELLP